MKNIEKTTRSAAAAAGSRTYFTGKPCVNGHVCERLTINWNCVECHRAHDAASYRRYADERREKQRVYWHATPTARQASRARQGEHGHRYMLARLERVKTDPVAREKYLAEKRRHWRTHWEANRARQAKWQREHPDHVRAAGNRRRARKLGAEGAFTADDVARIMRDQDGVCAACPADLADGYQVDHVHPLARGGSNWPWNLQLLCPRCNRSKGAKTMAEWKVAA